MTLKVVKNDTAGHGYCGPIAVASITGRKLSVVLDAFRESMYGKGWKREFTRCYGYRKRPAIRGVWDGNVRGVFDRFGYVMERLLLAKPMTIDLWVQTADRKADYLIQIDGHYIAVSGRRCCDTHTKGIPVSVSKFKFRADPIVKMWRVIKRRR